MNRLEFIYEDKGHKSVVKINSKYDSIKAELAIAKKYVTPITAP